MKKMDPQRFPTFFLLTFLGRLRPRHEDPDRATLQRLTDGMLTGLGRNEGVRKMVIAERKAIVGSPDLESLTTSHLERESLTVR